MIIRQKCMALNIHVHSKRIYVIRLWSMYTLCFIHFINVLKSAQLGLLLFGPQWGSNFRTPGQTSVKRVFAFPLFHTIWNTRHYLAIYCLCCWLQSASRWVRISLSRYFKVPELLVFALSLGRDDACPRAQPPFHRGGVCASSHYILRAEILDHCKDSLTTSKAFVNK